MKTLYTVSRCKKDGTLLGSSHGSDCGTITICGKELNHNWWITDNTFTGNINCKKCISIIEKYPTIQQGLKGGAN